eukprot:TRINITY_DN2697_c0_g1_i1.p1 TRINITY_DN2697_c0_g1~~TRINITY_DN2697_c0_g1_i1.p1  ORF type:complete len:799 (+),score=176.53 TRINITY_DN2697_c0_g1_i1:35-2398(+)
MKRKRAHRSSGSSFSYRGQRNKIRSYDSGFQSGSSSKRRKVGTDFSDRLSNWKKMVGVEQVEKSDELNGIEPVDELDAYMKKINQEYESATIDSIKKAQKTQKAVVHIVEPEQVPIEQEDEAQFRKSHLKILEDVDHDAIDYPPFRKNLYIEVPELKEMTLEEVKQYRLEELGNMRVRGRGEDTEKICPKPVKLFAQCGLSNRVESVMKKQEYLVPTPIQAQAIPTIMSGFDCIGIAKTGSGKTLAFVLPMIRHVLDRPKRRALEGPAAMVVVPTRELAIQITKEVNLFKKATKLACVSVYGGAMVQNQIALLKRGADIIVCTPGRLIDVLCLNKGKILNLQRITYLVLDEADRMFDLGFEKQIEIIVKNIRPDRQTVMFSATFPSIVQRIAKKLLTRPIEISVKDGKLVPDTIEQKVMVLDSSSLKFNRLVELISEWYSEGKILIFVSTQEVADSTYSKVIRSGYDAVSYHSGLDQFDRQDAITNFKSGAKKIMIATSLAARGLDVPDIRIVINYDTPNHLEDYVHRVGRTGRAGASGTAVTLIGQDEDRYASILVKALKKSDLPVPEELQRMSDLFFIKVKNNQEVKIHHGYRYGCRGYSYTEDEERNHVIGKLQLRLPMLEERSDVVEGLKLLTNEAVSDSIQAKAQREDEKKNITASERNEIETTKIQVQKVLDSLASNLSTGAGSSVRFNDRLEINDYPKNARYRAMKNSTLAEIAERTGAAVTAKGEHCPPGKPVPFGQEKLYLFIEGPDRQSVEQTKSDLKRVLEEASLISHHDGLNRFF